MGKIGPCNFDGKASQKKPCDFFVFHICHNYLVLNLEFCCTKPDEFVLVYTFIAEIKLYPYCIGFTNAAVDIAIVSVSKSNHFGEGVVLKDLHIVRLSCEYSQSTNPSSCKRLQFNVLINGNRALAHFCAMSLLLRRGSS